MTLKHIFFRFTRTTYVMDFREPESTRLSRCERYERKYKTSGKLTRFT